MLESYLPISISVISAIIALISISQSSKTLEVNQFQIIMNMYLNLRDLEKDLVKYQKGSEFESLDLFELTQEQICNHYEIYCAHYHRSSIDKKLFRDLFGSNVVQVVENPDYYEFFNLSNGDYDYCEIRKAYVEFKLLNL